ncbi:trimeric intracellular cation channel family protein [Flagellimonas meridianipacifica]|uniref:Putative membrane protein YeiH n=1 Tax=Flagellimonas meridianipacifica TaxID=1080225 RepID=A0A2T0MDB3_9FLAO|nr:trimeric intracellular cation channel family protein [Allomuricauda pacifica]PRX55487.1 putative membrane protein YeiH [Allomuricauda pacifica]
MGFYQLVDILGTIAFAVSGVLVAMDKRLDLFGVLIIAFVTAIGGGTLRDLLIGNTPVTWMRDLTYVTIIPITVLLTIIFSHQLKYLRKSLFLFDTIGIGLYTMLGIEKGLEANLSPIMCIALGTMTASFGGVLRDILCNEIPVIFRKEIYATACILGGTLYFIIHLLGVAEEYAYVVGILAVIVMRILAVRFSIRLPNIYSSKN